MSPQRRTALVSVGAACLLIAIKLVAGIASGSLGLLAEAAHSGTDLAAALVTFFAVLMLFAANPFSTAVAGAEPDGEGLNPLLQNYWMMIHPPTLYTGMTGWAVPFAFCIAALATGRLGDEWLRASRRWTLFAWIALVVQVVVIATLVNVVRVERLWPRSLTPRNYGAGDRRAVALGARRAQLIADASQPLPA